ncbi:MAG: hypothetical protein QOF98_1110 [Streptomyces sp.]|jgi:hypothetical protein|nr:hypothetical protein [Streptomyces sp.]
MSDDIARFTETDPDAALEAALAAELDPDGLEPDELDPDHLDPEEPAAGLEPDELDLEAPENDVADQRRVVVLDEDDEDEDERP